MVVWYGGTIPYHNSCVCYIYITVSWLTDVTVNEQLLVVCKLALPLTVTHVCVTRRLRSQMGLVEKNSTYSAHWANSWQEYSITRQTPSRMHVHLRLYVQNDLPSGSDEGCSATSKPMLDNRARSVLPHKAKENDRSTFPLFATYATQTNHHPNNDDCSAPSH